MHLGPHKKIAGGWRVLLTAGLLLVASAGSARAELPRFTAAAGTGIGTTFHREYTSGVPSEAAFGRYSARMWWAEMAWSFRSRTLIGVHAHLLRIPLEGEGVAVACQYINMFKKILPHKES